MYLNDQFGFLKYYAYLCNVKQKQNIFFMTYE